MPAAINVNRFIGHGDSCICYRCRVRREVAGFRRYLDGLATKFGGRVPRQFDYRVNFNQPEDSPQQPSNPDNMSLEQVESMKATIKSVLDYNEQNQGRLGPRASAHYVYCVDCGKWHRKVNEHYIMLRGVRVYLCGDCMRSRYRLCSECNLVHDKHTSKVIGEKFLCDACFNAGYYRCSHCDRIHPLGTERRVRLTQLTNSRGMNGEGEYPLCPTCARQVQVCSACNHTYFDSAERARQRNGLCQQCYADRGSIKNYSYKPAPRCKLGDEKKKEKLRKDTMLTGCEIEWEGPNIHDLERVCVHLTSIMGDGFMYFKRDGSIHHGFELVTHPFSWSWYVQNKAKLESMCGEAHTAGMRAQSNCGLHIHMNKKAFTHGQLYKLFKFMYRRDNRDFIINLSRRGAESHYATFHNTDLDALVKCAKTKINMSHQRYAAVNATGSNTIELRIWASPQNFLELGAAIEYCHSMHEWTNITSFTKLKYWDYLEWLSTREIANKYRNLVLWLRDNNLPNDKEKFRRRLKKNHVSLTIKKGV